jgi:hypothetical protein
MDVQVRTINTSARAPSQGEGAYRIAAVSGLLTTVAAGTATAGHLWAVRWSPAVNGNVNQALLVLQRLRARLFTVAGFTAAQEFGMDLVVARAYTASHSGGTAATLTTNNCKKRTSMPTTVLASMQTGTTGALTAGTHTLDAQPIASTAYNELAAAATVPKGLSEIYISTEDLDREPIVLALNEGLVIRNTVLMGAGGTARLVVEMDWLEVARY